jgi:hypothetical protein
MKDLFKSGLIMAAILALFSPLAAGAQCPSCGLQVQQIQQMPSPCGCGVAPNAEVVSPPCTLQVDRTDKVLFRVMNPTCAMVNFSIPCIGLQNSVPAGCEKTFFVDAGKINDAKLAYSIQNCQGCCISSGTVENKFYTPSDPSVALAKIIDYSKYTSASAPIKPEPRYYETPARFCPTKVHQRPVHYCPRKKVKHHCSQHVRGYW